MLNHLLLDSVTGSPEKYCTSLQSGGGHRGVQDAQSKMPVVFGLWHPWGGGQALWHQKGTTEGRKGEGGNRAVRVWERFLWGNLLSRLLQKVCPRPVSEEHIWHSVKNWSQRVLQKQRAGWATSYPWAQGQPAWLQRVEKKQEASPAALLQLHHPLITPSEPPCITCASLISHSFPQKSFLCLAEPPPFEDSASCGPTCQLWAPDVLTENRHSPGCLPSLHLLPVMKTEGAACSDSGYRSVKHGQNTARGTQGVGGWWGEGKGDTM